ncbi:hypothetical protein ADIAL_0928 [Alkalibacterium sp. AK22]|nr:hypothetical protein ADIAL_0928 [Alkalibacterium sp. AK22]
MSFNGQVLPNFKKAVHLREFILISRGEQLFNCLSARLV